MGVGRSNFQYGDAMNEREYMSAQRFPLTTQPGLTLTQQMMIDSLNYDEGREAMDGGALLTPDEKARMTELAIKDQMRKQLAGGTGQPVG